MNKNIHPTPASCPTHLFFPTRAAKYRETRIQKSIFSWTCRFQNKLEISFSEQAESNGNNSCSHTHSHLCTQCILCFIRTVESFWFNSTFVVDLLLYEKEMRVALEPSVPNCRWQFSQRVSEKWWSLMKQCSLVAIALLCEQCVLIDGLETPKKLDKGNLCVFGWVGEVTSHMVCCSLRP